MSDPPEFVAREMVLGRFENALKLALAAPYEFDRADPKREKHILRQHWGDWPALKAKLPRGHARSLVDYLVTHPADFKGAVARLRPELQGLYLSAYQSYLWNRMLAAWLVGNFGTANLVEIDLKLGRCRCRSRAEEKLREWNARTPLPSAGEARAGCGVARGRGEVLKEEGLTLAELKIRDAKAVLLEGRPPRACGPRTYRTRSNPTT